MSFPDIFLAIVYQMRGEVSRKGPHKPKLVAWSHLFVLGTQSHPRLV